MTPASCFLLDWSSMTCCRAVVSHQFCFKIGTKSDLFERVPDVEPHCGDFASLAKSVNPRECLLLKRWIPSMPRVRSVIGSSLGYRVTNEAPSSRRARPRSVSN